MSAPVKIDWERIEPEYRAGIKSLRQLAQEFGCTSGRVAQVAKKQGWTRDLSAKILAQAEAKLSKSIVSSKLSAERAASEKETVEASAEVLKDAMIGERTDVGRTRALTNLLVAELEAINRNLELFQKLGELMEDPDENGVDKLRDAYRAVISLAGRVSMAKQLADTQRINIELERKILKLDRDEEKTKVDAIAKCVASAKALIAERKGNDAI